LRTGRNGKPNRVEKELQGRRKRGKNTFMIMRPKPVKPPCRGEHGRREKKTDDIRATTEFPGEKGCKS